MAKKEAKQAYSIPVLYVTKNGITWKINRETGEKIEEVTFKKKED